MIRPGRNVAAGVAVRLVLVGCGQPPTSSGASAPAAAPVETPAPEAGIPSSVPGATSRDAEPMEDITGQEQTPAHTPPTPDLQATEDAEERAVAFMRAFARPDLPAEDWHAGLAGFMTPEAAEVFAYVDPANVPATQVTGGPVVLEERSAYLAEVHVPTDAGTYLVTLARTAAGEPWLVTYADPVD